MREATEQFKAMLAEHHKPDLAKIECAMVYQVWEDGEITLQKCGSLLWQRSLHCIEPGNIDRMVDPEAFPMHLCAPGQSYRHGYIFTDELGASKVRKAILYPD